MPSARRVRRAALGAFLGVLATLAVVGCADAAPLPQPTPSATGFASDDEAFAAAEATYRAYVDALNAEYAATVGSRAPRDSLSYLSGEAHDSELDALRVLQGAEVRIVGGARIESFLGQSASADWVEAFACLDVSGTRVVNSLGTDVTPTDRPPVQALQLRFDPAATTIIQSRTADAEC